MAYNKILLLSPVPAFLALIFVEIVVGINILLWSEWKYSILSVGIKHEFILIICFVLSKASYSLTLECF